MVSFWRVITSLIGFDQGGLVPVSFTIVLVLVCLSMLITPSYAIEERSNLFLEDTIYSTLINHNNGNLLTQGDYLVKSNGVREMFGVAGKGMKIGMIGNGVQSLNISQGSDELEYVHVLKTGVGDEGTAMLEIIHDIAPEAQLYFHAYGNNSTTFKDAVTKLAEEGCDIICDDLYFFRQPFMEDGDVAEHIRDILKKYPDLIYVTVAGNFAPLHYQGNYTPGNSSIQSQPCHEFSSGNSFIEMMLPPGSRVIATLEWDDPWGAAVNEYNVILLNPVTGKVLAIGGDPIEGTRDPFRHLVYNSDNSNQERVELAVIGTKTSRTNTLELFIRGVDPLDVQDPEVKDPYDSIFGHAAVEEVVTVGSVEPEYPFAISNDSSRGPVTIRYPQNSKRLKPDICAPTNVKVSGAGNFPSIFPGTSAAAPHVAAVIAQLKSAFPDTSREELLKVLYETAYDLGPDGWDETYGYGLIDAEQAYRVLYDRKWPMFYTNGGLFKN